ncbi:MAG: SDR family oxidoreductase [Candidatus Bilamarchaeaceae archaeon]
MLERVSSVSALDLFRLHNRIAFITGAAGYLGRSISWGLAEAGAHVVLAGRNEKKLKELAYEITEKGLKADAIKVDVRDENSVQYAFSVIGKKHGRLHILVNNAYEGSGGTIETSSSESFLNSYEVALIGAFRCIKAALPLLRVAVSDTGSASVINIASMYGIVSPDLRIYDSPKDSNPPFYGAAKAALIQFTKYAACEYAKERIRVNAISPGPFPKPEVLAQNPEFYRRLCTKTPLGRTGKPEELKGAVLFLASDASTFVTGINLIVDGGWTSL